MREESKIALKFLTGAPGRMEFPFTDVGELHEEQSGGEDRDQSSFWAVKSLRCILGI